MLASLPEAAELCIIRTPGIRFAVLGTVIAGRSLFGHAGPDVSYVIEDGLGLGFDMPLARKIGLVAGALHELAPESALLNQRRHAA